MNTRAFRWSILLLAAIAIVLPDFVAAQPACQPGRYASSSTGTCEACDIGRYQPALGQESCFPCEPGRFQGLQGRASCDACAAGRFQDAPAASTCQDCAAGSARDATGQTSCGQCGPGRFSPIAGATVCDACGPGRFSPISGHTSCEACGPGRFASDGASTCRSCDPGRYATDGAESCLSCGPGKFSGVAGATSCDSCSPGRFSGATVDALGETHWASTCTSPNAFNCYKTKDLKTPAFTAQELPVDDAYTLPVTTKVKGPAMVCAPVDLGSGVEDPSARQCCYKVSAPGLPKPHPRVETSGGRFAGSALEVLKSQLICEPCGADPLP